MAAKTRDLRLDNLKGILITLVVLGHYLWAYTDDASIEGAVLVIYAFHMPAFVFVSGFLSKDTLPLSWKGIAQLLVSYVLVNSAMLVFAYLLKGSSISLLKPYYSCWYLLALVVWRISLPFLAKHRHVLVLSVLMALALGFSSDIDNTFALARTIAFYPFFIGGFLFKKKLQEKRAKGPEAQSLPTKRGGVSALAGAAVLLCALAALLYAIPTLGITVGDELMWPYGSEGAFGLAKRAVLFACAAAIIAALWVLTPSRAIPCITAWGRNSLTIYLFHRVFSLALANMLVEPLFFGSEALFWAFMLVVTVLTLAVLGSNAVEGAYRAFVGRIVDILFAEETDAPSWHKRECLITVAALLAILLMVAQGVL